MFVILVSSIYNGALDIIAHVFPAETSACNYTIAICLSPQELTLGCLTIPPHAAERSDAGMIKKRGCSVQENKMQNTIKTVESRI